MGSRFIFALNPIVNRQLLTMEIEIDNRGHFGDFIRLNEQWIREHFEIEAADRELAANPAKIIEDGGCLISLTEGGQVVGVCALFREAPVRFQLARMAVDSEMRGQGCGGMLMEAALAEARHRGARSVYLMSNTVLRSAIRLYERHGFEVVSEGNHPEYARCNIVMEKLLEASGVS